MGGVFITGITGTLGTAIAKLHAGRGDAVYGCCQSESGAVEWESAHRQLRARVFNRDAADLRRMVVELAERRQRIDRVYHCAALKHVDRCQDMPDYAARQNVRVTLEVADACRTLGIPFVLSDTDKSCLPSGVYGATKLLARQIAIQHGGRAVRLGNLIGSSGSVFCRWAALARQRQPIVLTSQEMTRLFIPTIEAAREMVGAFDRPLGVVVPKMRAASMGDLAAMFRTSSIEMTGLRPGERLHEWLVAPGERAEERDRHYLVGAGPTVEQGISSLAAERWDLAELEREISLAVGGWK